MIEEKGADNMQKTCNKSSKRIMGYIMAAAAVTAMLTACDAKKDEVQDTATPTEMDTVTATDIDNAVSELDDTKPERLGDVRLAEYRDLAVTVSSEKIVTDEDVDTRVKELLRSYGHEADTAAVGDYVSIYYSVNGNDDVISAEIELGTHSFPDEIENAIIGMKKEETKEVAVHFPDDWHDEETAGTDCNISITVGSIIRPMELNEETVSEINKKYESADDFRTYVRDGLEYKFKYSYEQEKMYAALDAVKSLSETEPSDEGVEWAENLLIKDYYAPSIPGYMDMSLGELIIAQNSSLDLFRQGLSEAATQLVDDTLLIDAIASEAGITVTADDTKAYCDAIGVYEESLVEVFGREYVDLNVKEYTVLRYLEDQVVYVYADDAE